MNNLPVTTLFMLMSLDGKISTGVNDDRDFDKDLPNIPGIREGLSQYYALEEETDLYSFNTGRVMAKVGWNNAKDSIDRLPVTFIIVDNNPHLTELGVANLIKRTNKLYIVTTNKHHPAISITNPGLEVLIYNNEVDYIDLFKKIKSKGASRITIQSGGRMNAKLLRTGMINFVSIVIAPVLVGGSDTATLVDGNSFQTVDDLQLLRPLELIKVDVLENSYLHLTYKVLN